MIYLNTRIKNAPKHDKVLRGKTSIWISVISESLLRCYTVTGILLTRQFFYAIMFTNINRNL